MKTTRLGDLLQVKDLTETTEPQKIIIFNNYEKSKSPNLAEVKIEILFT